jgi:hypothetical protein
MNDHDPLILSMSELMSETFRALCVFVAIAAVGLTLVGLFL